MSNIVKGIISLVVFGSALTYLIVSTRKLEEVNAQTIKSIRDILGK